MKFERGQLVKTGNEREIASSWRSRICIVARESRMKAEPPYGVVIEVKALNGETNWFPHFYLIPIEEA